MNHNVLLRTKSGCEPKGLSELFKKTVTLII